MKKIATLSISLLISACATNSYDGNPHNYTDGGDGLQGLIKARYECIQEQKGYGSSSSSDININVSVNNFSDAGSVDCAAMNMCVAGKGYVRSTSGTLTVPKSFVVSCRY